MRRFAGRPADRPGSAAAGARGPAERHPGAVRLPNAGPPPERFSDRAAAGRRLAARLAQIGAGSETPVVLGLPRGGVPVAAAVAELLPGELHVLVARKIATPGRPELALGAVVEGGEPVWDHDLLGRVGRSPEDLAAVVARELEELARRVSSYRGDRPPPDVRGRDVVLVDDGIATGATARAALRSLRVHGARHLVLAAPVGAPDALVSLAAEADEVVVVHAPAHFVAVGQWYDEFGQLSDEDVRSLLRR